MIQKRLSFLGVAVILAISLQVARGQIPDFEMVLVEGGTFRMGSAIGVTDEQPAHEVSLDDFYIGRFEVTQQQWRMVLRDDTTVFYFEGCAGCPAERISWYNVEEFLKKLNQKTKLNYRLPTEAEWEFAARGGLKSQGFRYSGSNSEMAVSWNVENSKSATHPVGLKKPNELGIYDMTGNVAEWCGDWYSANWYRLPGRDNPTGPAAGKYRVIRGGSWFYDRSGLRVADRESANPSYRYGYVGFRLCRPAAVLK